MGLILQTLYNWVKAQRQGVLKGAGGKTVTAEQMEISRLRFSHPERSPTQTRQAASPQEKEFEPSLSTAKPSQMFPGLPAKSPRKASKSSTVSSIHNPALPKIGRWLRSQFAFPNPRLANSAPRHPPSWNYIGHLILPAPRTKTVASQ